MLDLQRLWLSLTSRLFLCQCALTFPGGRLAKEKAIPQCPSHEMRRDILLAISVRPA
jgi:hypothetical protein